MLTLCSVISIAAITIGALYDAKYRIIPNMVPIIIMLTKTVLGNNIPEAVLSLVITALCLGMCICIFKVEIPGGDFKLICSLAYYLGFFKLVLCLCAVFFLASFICFLTQKRSFPLCTYTAPVFAAIEIIEMFLK